MPEPDCRSQIADRRLAEGAAGPDAGAAARQSRSRWPAGGRASGYRVYALFAVVYVAMAAVAPRFLTAPNLESILKAASTDTIVAIGFTLVMITGQLDLSFGAVLTLGAMLAVGLQPQLGWGGSVALALAAGGCCGLVNGLLVARAKVSSFIATLGMMVIVQGIVNLYSKGGTLNVESFALGDWLDTARVPLLCPRVLLALLLVALFEGFLRRTRLGRGFFMVGGNAETAWLGGLNASGTVVGAFVIAGVLSGLGGALFGASLSSANPTMGSQSLMVVIAAVIIGGTSMQGGRGGVVGSLVALLTLRGLVNGLSCLHLGSEVQAIASGGVLAAIVLWDAAMLRRQERTRGRRPELLAG